MLPKENRLKKEKDFERILGSRRIREEFFILRVLKNDSGKIRFGITVSKKVSKKATVRNKTRRRILSLFSLFLPRTKEGTDILLTVLPGLEKKKFKEIQEMIEKIFKKSGLLKND